MKEAASYLYNFISPVTGELASFNQIPKAELGEILVAGPDGAFSPSLDLIDAKIDINYLMDLVEGIRKSSVIVQKPSDYFKNEQALSLLNNGYMVKGDDGIISTTTSIPPEFLSLPEGKLFIGNENNVATPSQIISIENLPNLYVATITGLELPAGKIWRGTSSYRPEESDALSIVEADILAINARFLTGNFIMGTALVQYAYPNAQYLTNIIDQSIEGTLLMKLGSRLKGASLTYNMVWKGNAEGFPQEAPYVSEERLQELVDEAQGFRDEAEGFAQDAEASATAAEASAGEASAAATEASAAAAEASGAASTASGAAFLAGLSAAAAAASAGVAGSYASDAEGYRNEAQAAAIEALANATLAKTYYDLLLTVGLNMLPCTGDVSLHGYRLIEVGDPQEGTDAVNKHYHDEDIERLQAEIDNIDPGGISELAGFVESTTTTDGVTQTIAGPLATLSLIPAGGDVFLENNRIKDLAYLPVDGGDAISASFLWDLLNNRIDDMIFRTQLDPVIFVPDSTQSFNYSDQQSNALFELVNDFQPTSTIPSNLKFDLINYVSKGYRSGLLTKSDNNKPTYLFSFVEPSGEDENATIESSPLLTFNEDQNDQFKSYKNIQSPDPQDSNHLTTKSWVLAQISGITPVTPSITLQGDITGSGPLSAPISTSLSTALSASLATKTYVDSKTWAVSSITDFNSSVSSIVSDFRLNQFLDPNNAVNMGNQRLFNLAIPTEGQDATSKLYVDSRRLNDLLYPNDSINCGNQRFWNLGAPVDGQDATNKSWVTTYVASQISTIPTGTVTFGGAVSGSGPLGSSPITTTLLTKLNQVPAPIADLSLASKKIINLANPINDQDAVTKAWATSTFKYSSGTFTPKICDVDGNDIIGDSTRGGHGYTLQLGKYYRFNSIVFIQISWAFGGGAYDGDTTPLHFTGLPFTPTFTGFEAIPIEYIDCGYNHIVKIFINMAAYQTIWPIYAIYQSQNLSVWDDYVNLQRGTINNINGGTTILNMNFCYSCDL